MRKAEVKGARLACRSSNDEIAFRSKRKEAINDRSRLTAAETHLRVTAASESGESREPNIRIDRNRGLKKVR